MFSKRYTIIVADRATGAVRRITVSVRAALFAVVGIMALPVLMGLGARLSATADIERLRARADALDTENSSYRAATGELTMQLSALQDVLDELGERARADEATAVAMSKLPTVVRQRAMGGSAAAAEQTSRALLAAAVSSPENTFGVLRDLLGVLENRLRVVRSDVERWEALAGATPSIWPAYGWLTDVSASAARSVHRRTGLSPRPRHLGRQGRAGLRRGRRRGAERRLAQRLRQPRRHRPRLRAADPLRAVHP
jgi:hypothetical protein